jgi:hypothetical protein
MALARRSRIHRVTMETFVPKRMFVNPEPAPETIRSRALRQVNAKMKAFAIRPQAFANIQIKVRNVWMEKTRPAADAFVL